MIPIFLTVAATLGSIDKLPYAPENLIYQSAGEVKDAVSAFEVAVDITLKRFVELCQAGQYGKAYQIWSDLQFQFFSLHLEFHQTKDLSLGEKVKSSLATQSTVLNKAYQDKLLSSDLLPIFLNNVRAGNQLSPQQRLWTEQILKEYRQISPQESEKITAALNDLSKLKQENFAVFKGLATPLDSAALKQVRVLTANIICFPDRLTYLFGGISPWKGRIDQLVRTISSTEAHIVCLQEVWDPEAMRALIEGLKDKYAYFIYNAGDPSGTLSLEKMGYSSGLFIASQLPLEDMNFYRFQRSIPQESNRGVVSATCLMGKQRAAVMTTHLQHGMTDEMMQVRKEQLHRCYALLQEATAQPNSRCLWGFIAGDLNVDAFSQEFDDSEFARFFSVPYAKHLPADSEKATATNYFSDLVRTPLNQRTQVKIVYELLDYCVQPAKSKNPIKSTQERIPLFSVEAPDRALSDHHALLTIWVLSRNDSAVIPE